MIISSNRTRIGAAIALSAFVSITAAAVPNPDFPPLLDSIAILFGVGNTQIPNALFWDSTPSAVPVTLAKSMTDCAAKRAQGIMPSLMLMMWPDTYYDSKPGSGRRYSSSPGYMQYWRWNNARQGYIARKADGSIWSRNYEADGTPKDAWISPSMPLEAIDQTVTVKTYADWYADRIASFCAATGLRGVFGADYFDSAPHHTTLDLDFHEKVIADFEKWRGSVVPGATQAEKAAYIKSSLFNQWTDYFSHVYAAWYAKIVSEIERRTGDSSRVMIQVEWTLPSLRRYKASDMRIYKEYFSRPDQFLYHIQVWYCMGSDEQTSHTSWLTGSLGTHLCREPGLYGGGHFINTGKDQMTSVESAHVMRLWGRVNEFCTARSLSLTPEQKTDLGLRAQKGQWMSFGWTHIATRQGLVRRAITYVLPSTNNYYIPDYWYKVIAAIAPARPLGPAFYYSVPVERKFEAQRVPWKPVDKLDNKVAGAFLPGYFVSDVALDSLKPASYPTCWITDDIDSIPAAEKAKLSRIAPICDIDTMEKVSAPVKFEGDATGYGFIDKQNRVIILALRDYWLNQTDITVKVNLSGFVNGTYSARDLLDTTKEFSIVISGNKGSFSFPLQKWDARAFVTTLKPSTPATTSLPAPAAATHARLTNAAMSVEYFTMEGRKVASGRRISGAGIYIVKNSDAISQHMTIITRAAGSTFRP